MRGYLTCQKCQKFLTQLVSHSLLYMCAKNDVPDPTVYCRVQYMQKNHIQNFLVSTTHTQKNYTVPSIAFSPPKIAQ